MLHLHDVYTYIRSESTAILDDYRNFKGVEVISTEETEQSNAK